MAEIKTPGCKYFPENIQYCGIAGDRAQGHSSIHSTLSSLLMFQESKDGQNTQIRVYYSSMKSQEC